MTRIPLSFNLAPGQQTLDAIARGLNDMGPVNKNMGEYMVGATERRFETSTAPDGSKWAPNSQLTLSRKKGNKPGIGETLSLSTQIHYEATGNSLVIGSTMDYSSTFHFGALMGAFGRYFQLSRLSAYPEGDFRRAAGSKKGHPIPWGNIPARPFLGVSQADEAELLAILQDYFGGLATS